MAGKIRVTTEKNTSNDNNKKRTFNIFEMTKEEKQKEYADKYTVIGLP
jgi:hypothetical protein